MIEKKKEKIKSLFANCQTKEEKYEKIIALGREAPSLDPADKVEENIVQGCQSTMYLKSKFQDGKMSFAAESDALISSGLAVLLTEVYSGETPETILKSQPDYLVELGIASSISPSRANGMFSIHLRMKQDALKSLIP